MIADLLAPTPVSIGSMQPSAQGPIDRELAECLTGDCARQAADIASMPPKQARGPCRTPPALEHRPASHGRVHAGSIVRRGRRDRRALPRRRHRDCRSLLERLVPLPGYRKAAGRRPGAGLAAAQFLLRAARARRGTNRSAQKLAQRIRRYFTARAGDAPSRHQGVGGRTDVFRESRGRAPGL